MPTLKSLVSASMAMYKKVHSKIVIQKPAPVRMAAAEIESNEISIIGRESIGLFQTFKPI